MKKQYLFVAMILIILYISYLIISFTYKEYKIKSHINQIEELNASIKDSIEKANKEIDYKKSKAYKNRILKEKELMKNKGEEVIYITEESEYKKYTEVAPSNDDLKLKETSIVSLVDTMNIFQKWVYFLFGKDIR